MISARISLLWFSVATTIGKTSQQYSGFSEIFCLIVVFNISVIDLGVMCPSEKILATAVQEKAGMTSKPFFYCKVFFMIHGYTGSIYPLQTLLVYPVSSHRH